MKITIGRLRDVVMLCLGTGGMVRELYLVPTPNLLRVTVSVGLLLGPAALLAWWSARTMAPPSAPPSPLPESSSQSPVS